MTSGPDDWELERRAFVADERDRVADERDRDLGERERLVDRREHRADDREHMLDSWERDLERQRASLAEAQGIELPGTAADARRRREESQERIRQSRLRTRRSGERRLALVDKKEHSEPPPSRLAQVIADTARQLFVADDPEANLARVVQLAADIVPACTAASVTLSAGPSSATVAASDPLAADLDAVQLALGSGPCLRVAELDGPTWVDGNDRHCWADFAGRAEALGVTGFLSYGLLTFNGDAEARLGALNLYSTTATAYTEDAYDVALILAAHLTIVAAAHHERTMLDLRERRMRVALRSRDVIGQAKGILMAREQMSADEAFDVLRRASQRTNTRLHEIAERVVQRSADGDGR
jgi:hypothetical protein